MITKLIFNNKLDELKNKVSTNFYKSNKLFFSKFKRITFSLNGKVSLIYSEENSVGKTLIFNSLFYVLGLSDRRDSDILISKIQTKSNEIYRIEEPLSEKCFFTFFPSIEFLINGEVISLERKIDFKEIEGKLHFLPLNEWIIKYSDGTSKLIKKINDYIGLFFPNWKKIIGIKKLIKSESKEKILIEIVRNRLLSTYEYSMFFVIFQNTSHQKGVTSNMFSINTYWYSTLHIYSIYLSLFSKNYKNMDKEYKKISDNYNEFMSTIFSYEKAQREIKMINFLKNKEYLLGKNKIKSFKNIQLSLDDSLNNFSNFEQLFTNEDIKSYLNIDNEIYKKESKNINQIQGFKKNFEMLIKQDELKKNLKNFREFIQNNIYKSTSTNEMINILYDKKVKTDERELLDEIANMSEKLNEYINSSNNFVNEIKKFGKEVENLIYEKIPIYGYQGAEKRENEAKLLNEIIKRYDFKVPYIAIDAIGEGLEAKKAHIKYLELLFENIDMVDQYIFTLAKNKDMMKNMREIIENKNSTLNLINLEKLFILKENINENIKYEKFNDDERKKLF